MDGALQSHAPLKYCKNLYYWSKLREWKSAKNPLFVLVLNPPPFLSNKSYSDRVSDVELVKRPYYNAERYQFTSNSLVLFADHQVIGLGSWVTET